MRTALIVLMCLLCDATCYAVDLLADLEFRQGFVVKDRQGKDRVFRWDNATEPADGRMPPWHITQHCSKSCFADDGCCTLHTDGLTFKDRFEQMAVHPKNCEGDIVLGVNANNEFNGVYRGAGDAWPHLYVEQQISNPYGRLASTKSSLEDIQRIDLNISVRLLYDRKRQSTGSNPQIHAAQFLLLLTVQNQNSKSKGFGDYYWFGISLFDSRYKVTQRFASQDKSVKNKKGTGKWIYDVGVAPFTSQQVVVGNWVRIQGNLLPHIRNGLTAAWEHEYLPDSKAIADYRIGMFILGWEITGLDVVAIAVKDLSLVAVLK